MGGAGGALYVSGRRLVQDYAAATGWSPLGQESQRVLQAPSKQSFESRL